MEKIVLAGRNDTNPKSKGIKAPMVFDDTYCKLLDTSNNITKAIKSNLERLRNQEKHLSQEGEAIRKLFWESKFPEDVELEFVRHPPISMNAKNKLVTIGIFSPKKLLLNPNNTSRYYSRHKFCQHP